MQPMFKPGALYCAALHDPQYPNNLRYEGLYWYGADGNWYSAEIDDIDSACPAYDVMVEQIGAFNPDYTEGAR